MRYPTEDSELMETARTIAADAEATVAQQAYGQLDRELLAYSIGRERVHSGKVPFAYQDLMAAIEHAIEEAKRALSLLTFARNADR